MIKECASRVSHEIIERVKKLSVPLILDGVKASGITIPMDGCMLPAIGPVDRNMFIAGTALTIETSDGDNFPIHLASYMFNGEGYVLVIDGKGCEERSYLGDLIMSTCQAVGFNGIVIDGYTRDRNGNIDIGFPVFSRGFMPRGPIKKSEGKINTPIECAGVRVCPGDLVVGDCDGVCVIPRENIETVLAEAEKKLSYEKARRKTIEGYIKAKQEGGSLPELAPQWVIDMRKTEN